MTTNICTIESCERVVHNAGMCRPHREQHLHGTSHPGSRTLGETRPRVKELVEYYGTVGAAAKAIRISRGTITRVLSGPIDDPLKITSFNRIMTHKPGSSIAPVVTPVTRTVVAEYALTDEGKAFIARCRIPDKYRQETAA